MKRNPDILRTFLFALFGILFIYILHHIRPIKIPHYIQEDKFNISENLFYVSD